jgi:hypothetical protein
VRALRYVRVGADLIAVSVGYLLAGVIAAAVLAVFFIVVSLRRAKVISIPKAEQATRGDAAVIAARIEVVANELRQRSDGLLSIAQDIKEGR